MTPIKHKAVSLSDPNLPYLTEEQMKENIAEYGATNLIEAIEYSGGGYFDLYGVGKLFLYKDVDIAATHMSEISVVLTNGQQYWNMFGTYNSWGSPEWDTTTIQQVIPKEVLSIRTALQLIPRTNEK